jgi:CHAT domain-containing protein/tetratricopeptide (TPR) repeat protein
MKRYARVVACMLALVSGSEMAVGQLARSRDLREGQALRQQGETLRRQGDYAGAVAVLDRTFNSLRHFKAPRLQAATLMSLARTYAHHGQLREALAVYKRALAIYERTGNSSGTINGYQSIAMAHAWLGKRGDALDWFEKARALISREGERATSRQLTGLAYAYHEAGEYERAAEAAGEALRRLPNRQPLGARWILSASYFRLGRYEELARLATDSIEKSAAAGRREAQMYGYLWRARSLDRLGRREEAARDAIEVERLAETMRGRLLPDDSFKRGFSDLRQELTHHTVAILWSAGCMREALEAAERGRARAFGDLLAARNRAVKVARPPLFSAGFDEPHVRSDAFARAWSASDLARLAERLESPVIAYWVHPKSVYVWAVSTSGEVNGARVKIPEAKLNGLIERARRVTAKPDYAAWKSLYRVLIAPVERHLSGTRGSTLTILPHGILFQLPFGALIGGDGRYLIERFSFRTGPSAAVFEPARQTQPGVGGQSLHVLAGDPAEAAAVSGERLAALPGARSEVKGIAADLRARSIVLTGKGATKERIVTEAESAGVLHLATHAVIDPLRPFESYLALSGGSRLTAGEIYAMRTNADLVWLSACASGSGKISADGLLGFTRAFFYAGASAVVAPVWNIADGPNARLTVEYYRQYRRLGDKSRALRAAQLRLLDDLRAGRVVVNTPAGPMIVPEHPWLWAGFVLQGAG